jgi:hypothetical protein
MALGIRPDSPTVGLSMIELYDPATGTRAIGPSPTHLRARPESLLLPDGRVIAFGGEYTGNDPSSLVLTNAGTVQNVTQVADLFDPISDSWRPMSDMTRFIHYHNVSVLAPDGRVMTTAGAGSSGPFGDDDSVEAFEPPYLFWGIRPRIDSVSSTELEVGGTYSLQVSLTEQVTRVVLLGTRAVTHWVDSGTERYLTPAFSQNGPTATFTLSDDPAVSLPGYYILFAMVDDVPSHGIVLPIKANTPELFLRSLDVESGMFTAGWNSLGSNYLYPVEESPTLATGS